MPGMENFAPERTLTSSGSSASPSVRPMLGLEVAQVPGDFFVKAVGDGAFG